MRDTIDMAEEAGAISYWHLSKLKAFEALVRADERDKWMERAHIMILGEREACAKAVEQTNWSNWFQADAAAAIRARGNT
jgi:hypothetical protein